MVSNNVNFGDMSTNRLQADSIRLLCGICSGFVHVLGHRVASSMVSHGQASVFNSEPGILTCNARLAVGSVWHQQHGPFHAGSFARRVL